MWVKHAVLVRWQEVAQEGQELRLWEQAQAQAAAQELQVCVCVCVCRREKEGEAMSL
jgi:alkanesulfonate monooxygenase SsuD/methylene tetrahydromethanopterin reductase-like flavin-dependent oxidoreductase (luciferase family)